MKTLLTALLISPISAQAIPVFDISSPTASITLKPGQSTTHPIHFTVRNNSGIDMPNISFNANYIPSRLFTTKLVSGAAGACLTGGTLLKNASCTLSVLVKANHLFGSSLLRPRVCGFSGTLCSRGSMNINVASQKSEGRFTFEDSKGQPITSLNLSPGSTDTVTLKNTGSVSITRFSLKIGTPPKGTRITANTCSSIGTLSKNGSCHFTYKVDNATSKPTSGIFIITASGDPTTVSHTPYPLPVIVSSSGHFAFEDSKGDPIRSLNLSPGSTDTITLKNTGSMDITGFTLGISTLPNGTRITTNTCTGKRTLDKNAACDLTYQVDAATSKPKSGSFAITASGDATTVDNTPNALPVDVASSGHFVFEDGKGNAIKSLNLSPGSMDAVILKNTGGVNITGFALKIGKLPLGTTIKTNTCTTIKTFTKNSHCTLIYRVAQAVDKPKPGRFTITASGDPTTVNNTSLPLSVDVSSAGHFIFEDSTGNKITTLNLSPDSTDTIELKNTGGTDISGFTLVIGTLPKGTTIINNTCAAMRVLTKNNFCDFTYQVANATSKPTSGIFAITASGNATTVDDTPHSLSVDVAKAGHFVFENGKGTPITSLNLSPGSTDTIKLKNTGGIDISGFAVKIGTLPKGTTITANTCTGMARLTTSNPCSLTYHVDSATSQPASGKFEIIASGDAATVDDTSHPLSVDISSAGQFVFENSKGQSITKLNLSPGSTDTITLKNTGGIDITGFALTIDSPPTGTQIIANHCAGMNTLAKHNACTFTYQVDDATSKPTSGKFTITATGDPTTVSATPHKLAVNIASAGHFVLEEGSSQPLDSVALLTNQNTQFVLKNAGGTPITNLAVTIPTGLAGNITDNCPSTLNPNGTCSFTLRPFTSSIQEDISISGTGADNTPKALQVTIAERYIIAVGDDAYIFTSIDGRKWKERSRNQLTWLTKVIFHNGIYLASGGSGSILRSPDAITWTAYQVYPHNSFLTVIYANSRYIAAGSTTYYATSTDGKAWTTTGQYKGPSGRFEGIALGGSTYVMVGETGTRGSPHFHALFLSSTDGINYTEQTAANAFPPPRSVAYGNRTFVAVGENNSIETSTNGVKWVLRRVGPAPGKPNYTLNGVMFYDHKFVLVGYEIYKADDGIIETSPDGRTWHRRYTGNIGGLIGIGYANFRFIATGWKGVILTSKDAINWTLHNTGIPNSIKVQSAG